MASQLSPLQLEGCHNELTFSSIDEFVNEGFSPELEQSFKIVTAEPISDRPTEGFHGCFVSVAARESFRKLELCRNLREELSEQNGSF